MNFAGYNQLVPYQQMSNARYNSGNFYPNYNNTDANSVTSGYLGQA